VRRGELPHLVGGVWPHRLLIENNLFLLTFSELELAPFLQQLAAGEELAVVGGLCDGYLFDRAGLLELATGVTAVTQMVSLLPRALYGALAQRPAVGG
jgi:hypothetical protein